MSFWHVLGGEHVTGDLAGAYMTLVIGPTDWSDPSKIDLGQFGSLTMEHLAVFDHEPSDFEKDQCQPLEFRDHRPSGKVIEWDKYDFDGPLECFRAGAHLQDVDEDGYCNRCGHDDPNPEADIEAAITSIRGASDGTTEDRPESGR